MNEEQIKQALAFYQINEENYKNKCLKSLEELEKNPKLLERVLTIRKRMLEDDEYLKSLWNIEDLEEILKESSIPFLSNIILLSAYPLLKENKRNFSNKQIKIAKKRIRESLLNDIIKRKYKSIRISQMLWGIYFAKERIIEIGRLQYELSFINPLTNEVEQVIKIHIPKGKSLEIKEVKNSLKKAPKEIKNYFHLENPKYYCSSWLLSKEVLNELNENSNIFKFSQLFDINDGNECTSDILNFVFGLKECQNMNELPENPYLQKILTQKLLEGKSIHLGIGLLKK